MTPSPTNWTKLCRCENILREKDGIQFWKDDNKPDIYLLMDEVRVLLLHFGKLHFMINNIPPS